jgi:DNA modification methylase
VTIYFQDESITVYHGDCRDVLPTLPDQSVDAICTDPPYELNFMNRAWDATGVAFDVGVWRECLRVLKPGAHLVAFGGTRTWHRLAVAIEDSGFEIRDNLAWLYGSGFTKSMDVSMAIDKAAGAEREVISERRNQPTFDIDKQAGGGWAGGVIRKTAPATDDAKRWNGWGTHLKPSFEPIVLARKPFRTSVADNVLKHGTGAIHIDACRIPATDSQLAEKYASVQNAGPRDNSVYGGDDRDRAGAEPHPAGRFPPNALLDAHTAVELDDQSYNDDGGASRFFPVFKYTAKAPTSERPNVDGMKHPTVKPLEVMKWLVKLVTPPHGVVLDPFAGTGTTAEACIHEHKHAIMIEKKASYLPLIKARLGKPMEIGFDFDAI